MQEIPDWIKIGIPAIIGFAVAWGIMKANVGSLKQDISEIKGLISGFLVSITELRTIQNNHGEELKLQRGMLEFHIKLATEWHSSLLQRVSVLEARQEETN